ncbi:PAS domain-containing protein [Coleofasciculus sp. H7-2]|uniref:PAS domain-containing protein n=1 Tax=Coleofasciculus sp. H7-2 TaxID=3351545 RepID=UPI00366BF357
MERLEPVDLKENIRGLGTPFEMTYTLPTADALQECHVSTGQSLSGVRTLSTLMSNLPGMAYRCRNDQNWTMEAVSEGCYPLTGYSPFELIGNREISYAQLIHPDDRERVWKAIQAAVQENRPFQLVYRIITAAGEEKFVWEQGCGVFSESGELLALEGLIVISIPNRDLAPRPANTLHPFADRSIDISDRQRAEEEIQLLQTLTQAISAAPDFHTALSVALRQVCEMTGWNFGEAWIPSSDGTILECSPAWYSSTLELQVERLQLEGLNQPPNFQPNTKLQSELPLTLSEFRLESEILKFSPGIGLPGRVWLSKQPEWIPDASIEPPPFFIRTQFARNCGLKAGFAVPIISKDRVVAILTFFLFESRQKDKRLVELVSAVAAHLGTVMQQKKAEAALGESQRRLASLIDSLPGIVFSCGNDPAWSMTYISEGCFTLTGYHSEELIGDRAVSYDSITHPEDLPKVLEAIATGITLLKPYVVEYRIRTQSGVEKWVWEKGAAVYDSAGKVLGLEGFITDITERKRTEEALQQAEAKYRSIFENAIEGIFQTTPDGQYISANPALARIYGYESPTELMARLTDIKQQLYVDPNRRAEFKRLLQEHDVVSEFESAVSRQDSSIIWISENARAVRDCEGKLLYYEGTVEDITERKRAKEQLRERAFYDTLTGLPNRALFMDRLSQAVERAKQYQDFQFALLFVDLDGFKKVNDSLGHLVGDKLLVALADRLLRCVAHRLETCVRAEDIVARLGGDEFTLLLEAIDDLSNATSIAERINRELTPPFYLDGHEVFTGASIGIVLSTGYDRPEDLLRDADTALYRAKALGKGRYEVFDNGYPPNKTS